MLWGGVNHLLAADVDRGRVHGVHIACAIVESIMIVQLKEHRDKTMMACEVDAARYTGVF